MISSVWLWVGFVLFILAMLVLDLSVFHRRGHAVSFKEALGWTATWVTLALLFGVGVWQFAGQELALEFYTGWLIEYSLSMDNLFVFALIFSYFAVPPAWQRNVLFWGILGALVMRLAQQPGLSVSELAAPFAMSLPAVMKHLDVLSDAGLVKRTKAGRTVACRLDAEPMRDAFEWLNRYEKFWSERLSSLAAFLEEESWQSNRQPKPPRTRASRSSAGSMRRRTSSMPPGQTQSRS